MPPKKGGVKALLGKVKEKAGPAKKSGKGPANQNVLAGGGNLRLQLHALGLRIATVEGDGNCFFRAMCDQLEGKNGDYKKLRAEVMDYVEQHPDDFAPFVEDDVPFEKYVSRMRGDGAWAGNIEVQACSLLRRVNVCIHQGGQAPWVVANWPGEEAAHLAYEGDLHYDSAGDTSAGPGGPFALGSVTAADIAAAGDGDDGPPGLDEVLRGIPAGVADRATAAEALRQMEGDVGAAIEFLIETWSSEVGAGAEEAAGDTGEASTEAAAAGGQVRPTDTAPQKPEAEEQGAALDGERAATGTKVESSGEVESSSDSSEEGGCGPATTSGKGTEERKGAGKGADTSSAAGGTKQQSARSALLERKKARKEEKELAKQRRAAAASRKAAGDSEIAAPTPEEQAALARSLGAVRI